MHSWEKALMEVCELSSTSPDLEWILVGSVGSVLQGCDMTPGDVDIYVRHHADVERFARILEGYSLQRKYEGPLGNDWLSSIEQPVFTQTFGSGFTWTKGCWLIEGFKVEVVHISDSAGIPDSLSGEGIWEGGRFIWSYCKLVKCGAFSIPAVPLEIQLESNLRRKRMERVQSIVAALKQNGYDADLLNKALSTENLNYFASAVK
ncbi:hypothetical protein [Paenibacillus koleovorans]|uniref:hypothetical protein n=1 Tax=Paenibacillus koleovorans TaxID=121608 RepID=UPI000FDA9624|nr:hypothetical protein [Paenibacillus koleovorans]